MKADCQSFLQSHLAPDESLLWTGGIADRHVADATTRRFVLGMVAVFALGGLAVGIAVPQVAPYVLFSALLIGSYFFLAWSLEQEAANACYGLTDRRVLMRGGLLRPKLTSVDLLDIAEVRLFKTLGGRACLELVGEVNRALVPGVTAPVLVRGGRRHQTPAGPRLTGIADADAVRERILAAQRALLGG